MNAKAKLRKKNQAAKEAARLVRHEKRFGKLARNKRKRESLRKFVIRKEVTALFSQRKTLTKAGYKSLCEKARDIATRTCP